MTSTASEAASYEFTTLTCIPGVIEVSGSLLGCRRGKGMCLCFYRVCVTSACPDYVCVSEMSVCFCVSWVCVYVCHEHVL